MIFEQDFEFERHRSHTFMPFRVNLNTVVKRSRDPSILETCDIVVDVGAVYDESKQLFDHHQRGFTEVFGHGFNTKLSSAGLVYKSVNSRVHFTGRTFE